MAETTELELVTPGSIMVQQAAEMVVVPGVEGLFGVLPRHSSLLADLGRGVVEIYQSGKITDRFMIDGGLADVSAEKVTILAERAIDLRKAEVANLKSQVANASGDDFEFLNAVIAAL
jgi:F-type H+-transporting ATPase subunit epsilon